MVSDAGGGGTSYGFQNGAYVKIGTFVYVFGEVQVTAANWASGNVQIGGLPFVVDSTRGWGANGSFGYYNNTNMTSFAYYFSMFPGNALSYIYFKNSGGSVGLDGLLQAGGVAAGCRFQLSFAYRTTP
jgi:hypothetical protein